MKITIQPSALADLKNGFRFYEGQAPGLGNYFLDSVSADIDSLQLYAGTHPRHFERFFRLLSRRFPFAIYYELQNETIQVRAVLDLRRDPNGIARRLRGLM